MFLGKIFSDNTDEMDRSCEIGGGDPSEGSGTAQEVFPLGDRSFDVVNGDGTADQD